jgi:hypothetical protein
VLVDVRLLSLPEGAGAQQGLMGGESEGWVSGHSMHSWSSAGPEGWWAGGEGQVSHELWDYFQAGVWYGWGTGIPVVMDVVVWPRGRYPSVV